MIYKFSLKGYKKRKKNKNFWYKVYHHIWLWKWSCFKSKGRIVDRWKFYCI